MKTEKLHFLYNNPTLEKELKIDEKYVIISKVEWEFIKQHLLKNKPNINDIYASRLLDKQLEQTHCNEIEYIEVNRRKILKNISSNPTDFLIDDYPTIPDINNI